MDCGKSSVVRRALRASVFGILGAALMAPAAAQASALPGSTTLSGTYALVHVDGTAGHPDADGYQQELLSNGHAYAVQLRDGVSFRSGDTVALKGTVTGNTLQVQSSAITAFAPDEQSVGGVTKVLVILATWTAPDSTTQASAASVFAADSAWYAKSSYGALRLSTTVSNWVQVAPPAAGLCSDPGVSTALTTRALAAAGYNGNAFDRVVVYFPNSIDHSCNNVAGFAQAPGNRVWLNGVMDMRSTLHEQGHNYGLYHAHSAVCTTPGGTTAMAAPDPAGDNCSYSDYGDPFDAMGASNLVADYSASQKNVLGWLGGRTAALTPNSSATLVPYEQQSGAVHAASYGVSATRTYWFENRTATDDDAALPKGATDGVLVHVDDTVVDARAGAASAWAPAQTYLLDLTPGDRWLGTSVLPYGQSWISPEGVTFTVANQGAGGTVTLSATVPTPGADPSPKASAGAAPAGAPPAQSVFLSSRLVSGHTTQTVTEGSAVVMSGTALRSDGSGAAGTSVELQVSRHGQHTWTTFKTLSVTGPGFLSAAIRPVASSDYRLHVAATPTTAPADSASFSVLVQPVLIAALSEPAIRPGHTVGLNVRVPGHAGQVVLVERFVHHRWTSYAKVRLGSGGRRSVVVRIAAKGQYLYRFVKSADATHVGSKSKALRVIVVA